MIQSDVAVKSSGFQKNEKFVIDYHSLVAVRNVRYYEFDLAEIVVYIHQILCIIYEKVYMAFIKVIYTRLQDINKSVSRYSKY